MLVVKRGLILLEADRTVEVGTSWRAGPLGEGGSSALACKGPSEPMGPAAHRVGARVGWGALEVGIGILGAVWQPLLTLGQGVGLVWAEGALLVPPLPPRAGVVLQPWAGSHPQPPGPGGGAF